MYIRRDELKTAEKEWQKIIWGYFWGYIGKQYKNKKLNINKLKLTFCSCWGTSQRSLPSRSQQNAYCPPTILLHPMSTNNSPFLPTSGERRDTESPTVLTK